MSAAIPDSLLGPQGRFRSAAQDGRWLVVRIAPIQTHPLREEGLASDIWRLAEAWNCHDIVLEMEEVSFVSSPLMGELVLINKRLYQHDGRLRLCSFQSRCLEALHISRLDELLACFSTRQQAVGG